MMHRNSLKLKTYPEVDFYVKCILGFFIMDFILDNKNIPKNKVLTLSTTNYGQEP